MDRALILNFYWLHKFRSLLFNFSIISFILCSIIFNPAYLIAGSLDHVQPGTWYEVPNSNLSAIAPSPSPYGNENNVINAWSGGTFDTKNRRLLVHGGGHADYGGNEIYAFDLSNLVWQRVWGPTAASNSGYDPYDSPSGTCYESYWNGDPVSIHSYSGLTFLPNQNQLFRISGSKFCGGGDSTAAAWSFDFDTDQWTRLADSHNFDNLYGACAVYNASDGFVYALVTETEFKKYNPNTDQWISIGTYGPGIWTDRQSAVIDPVNNNFIIVGHGYLRVFNMSTGAYSEPSYTGGSAIVNAEAPGFVYDPIMQKPVAYPNTGTSVYSLDVATWTWTEHKAAEANSVTPPTRVSADGYKGTYGRFAYDSIADVYVYTNDANGSVFIYRPAIGRLEIGQPPSDMPTNTWVRRSLPGDFSPNPNYGQKDMRIAFNPDDGKIYIFGGDWLYADNLSSSGQTAMLRYDILTDTWEEVHDYCMGSGIIQPRGPDEGIWVYDTNRNKFWWIPGFQHNVVPDCGQPADFLYMETMSFDPATENWSTGYTEPSVTGDMSKYGVYDPITDKIYQLLGDGNLAVQIYNISSNSWTTQSFSESAYIGASMPAIDTVGRKIYVLDPIYDRLYVYDISKSTFTKHADVPFDISAYTTEWDGLHNMRLFWDSANEILLWPQINGNEGLVRFHTYKPSTDTWEVQKTIVTSPSGQTVRGNAGVYDPNFNVLVYMGGSHYASPYFWLYRYETGTSLPPPPPQPLSPPANLRIIPAPDSSDLIKSIDVVSNQVYRILDNGLQVGANVYIDRDFSFSAIPSTVQNATFIQTANDDKRATDSNFISFEVAQDVTVFVAYDDRILSKPGWIQMFTDTGEYLSTTDISLKLFSKDFSAGTISLGGNFGADYECSMYSVIIVPKDS